MAGPGATGGGSLEAALNSRVSASAALVKVGFLEGATYPDGTPVAQVAAWNEYGTTRSPMRDFFRSMIRAKGPKWGEELARVLKTTGGDVPKALALMGERISDQLTQSIVEFSDPPNAKLTVDKKGFNQPLLNTGTMQRSAGYEVDEGKIEL